MHRKQLLALYYETYEWPYLFEGIKLVALVQHNKAMKNRPQKAWAGLANARLLLRRYECKNVVTVASSRMNP